MAKTGAKKEDLPVADKQSAVSPAKAKVDAPQDAANNAKQEISRTNFHILKSKVTPNLHDELDHLFKNGTSGQKKWLNVFFEYIQSSSESNENLFKNLKQHLDTLKAARDSSAIRA